MATKTAPLSYDPLHSSAQMSELIASATGIPAEEALRRLRAEFEQPGSTVGQDCARRGIEPYVWSKKLIDFYRESDAFLYELAVWNRNAIKRKMRKRLIENLARFGRGKLDVLSVGDGLGFDCLALAKAGHRVTYFELPGYSEAVARRLFQETQSPISVITEPEALTIAGYDAVVCLDVLEHVPDPPAQVRQMAGWLRPGGLLVSHSPFYLIHPAYATHLRSNRQYSGSLRLYTDNGFELLEAGPMWMPLVLRKPGGTPVEVGSRSRRGLRMRLDQLYLRLGRLISPPGLAVEFVRRSNGRWFDKT